MWFQIFLLVAIVAERRPQETFKVNMQLFDKLFYKSWAIMPVFGCNSINV